LWSLASFLGASGLLLMIQTIGAEIGPFRFAELGSRDPRARVGIWLAPGAPAATAPPWQERLGSEARVRPLASLGGLGGARLGAVVLPEPRVLAESDAKALSSYLAAGGGVVLTGSIGVRDPDGSWRGYERMRSLLGAEPIPLAVDAAQALVAARRGVLSSPLVPRERIAIRAESGLPGLPGAAAELTWASEDGATTLCGSLRHTVGRGRLAWLAVGPEGAAHEADARELGRRLQAPVAWVGGRPLGEVLPWPGAARFAAVLDVHGDVESGARTPLRFAVADEIEEAEASGGLAHLRARAAGAGGDPVVAETVAELAQRGAWLASRSELA